MLISALFEVYRCFRGLGTTIAIYVGMSDNNTMKSDTTRPTPGSDCGITVGVHIGNEQGEIKVIEILKWDGTGCAMCVVEYVKNGSGTETMAIAALRGLIESGEVKVLA